MTLPEVDEKVLCQEKNCHYLQRAVMVCRHPGCMVRNGNRPLLLCHACDRDIHSLPQNNGHLIVAITDKDIISLSKTDSYDDDVSLNQSCSDLEANDDADGRHYKKFHPTSKFGERESKLKRKKALRSKRLHNENDPESVTEPSGSGRSPRTPTSSNSYQFDYSSVSLDSSSAYEKRRNSKLNLSNESITLHFPNEDGTMEKEVICALKNTSLKEALCTLLEKYDLHLNDINVYVENSNTPLPLHCETFLLGGNTLFIKKDKDIIEPPSQHARSSSLGSVSVSVKSSSLPTASRDKGLKFHPGTLHRQSVNFSLDDATNISVKASASPHATWSADRKSQRSQIRLSSLFNVTLKDKEKMDQLNDLLNSYSNSGLPRMPQGGDSAAEESELDDSVYQFEPHWSSLVNNASSLNKRQHDHQESIWELLQTETHYITSIRVVADVFMCVLLNLQKELLLTEVESDKLFSNIREIVAANNEFWSISCVKVLQESRKTRQPLNMSLMKEGFKKFPEIFKPYTKYCLDQKPCSEYMKSVYRENDLFKSFVVWAEAQPSCNRLKLTDLLVKPMQRLTKYSLLLQAVLRKTDEDRQRKDILEMISQVDNFVANVNGALRKNHDREQLSSIVAKLELVEIVEPPNDECKEIMHEYTILPDLMKPMPHCNTNFTRSLLFQSVLRMKYAQTRIDVEFLLFTDLLLICKANKRLDKYRVIRPPMRVDRIIVRELRDKTSFLLILMNEYRVPVWAVTFHAADPGSIKSWMEYIKKAQDAYCEAKAASKLLAFSDPRKSKVSDVNKEHKNVEKDNDIIKNLEISDIPRQRSFTMSESDHTLSPSADTLTSPTLSKVDKTATKISIKDSETFYQECQKLHTSRSLPYISLAPNEATDSDNSISVDSSSKSDKSTHLFFDQHSEMKETARRNSRSERRYTADSIHDFDHLDRDTNIYKRLSWNVGTSSDLHIQDRFLQHKTYSSDSLRSYHSSSGVSSTSSSHHVHDDTLAEDASESDCQTDDTISKSENLPLSSPSDFISENSKKGSDMLNGGKNLDDSCDKIRMNRLNSGDLSREARKNSIENALQFNTQIISAKPFKSKSNSVTSVNKYNSNNETKPLDFVSECHKDKRVGNRNSDVGQLNRSEHNLKCKSLSQTPDEINICSPEDYHKRRKSLDDLLDDSNKFQFTDANGKPLEIHSRVENAALKKTQSKSTTDIISLFNNMSFNDIQDGIASVNVPNLKNNKQLSSTKMKRLKHLMMISDSEASEV